MDRYERESQLLMGDVRAKGLSLGGKDCLRWVKAGNDSVKRLHNWKYHALRKDFEALIGIPKVRVLDDGLIIFGAAEAYKLDTHVAGLSLEELTGDQGHMITTLPQFAADANERVHVAGASDGAQENI